MEINEAIDTMKRLRIALATVNVDGKRVLEPISMAIEALEKQIPKNLLLSNGTLPDALAVERN